VNTIRPSEAVSTRSFVQYSHSEGVKMV